MTNKCQLTKSARWIVPKIREFWKGFMPGLVLLLSGMQETGEITCPRGHSPCCLLSSSPGVLSRGWTRLRAFPHRSGRKKSSFSSIPPWETLQVQLRKRFQLPEQLQGFNPIILMEIMELSWAVLEKVILSIHWLIKGFKHFKLPFLLKAITTSDLSNKFLKKSAKCSNDSLSSQTKPKIIHLFTPQINPTGKEHL